MGDGAGDTAPRGFSDRQRWASHRRSRTLKQPSQPRCRSTIIGPDRLPDRLSRGTTWLKRPTHQRGGATKRPERVPVLRTLRLPAHTARVRARSRRRGLSRRPQRPARPQDPRSGSYDWINCLPPRVTSDRHPDHRPTSASEAARQPASKFPGPHHTRVSVDSNGSLHTDELCSREATTLVTRSDTVCCMGEGGWPHGLRWWGGAILAAICAGAAFIAELQAGEHLSPWASMTITLGGASATVLALLLPARQTWIEVRGREDAAKLAKLAVANYQLAVRSVLLPLTDIFDQIVTASNDTGRMEAQGAAKQAVVNSVVQFTGVARARSCYFEYEYSDQERRLVCRIYAGRDAKPRTEFSSANPSHAEVFKLLEDRRSELKENIALEESLRFPPGRDYNYKTYISVPVATSAEIFGLLTLDALHAGELVPQHEREMLLLAQLLGIALAGGGRDRSSTTVRRQPAGSAPPTWLAQ